MALSVDVRTVDGSVAGTVTLDEKYFGIQPNVPVMHQVVTAQLAAARAGTHSTKTRAEVAGGGKKPFKQKGTGRARQGSIRAPQWTGGGVALGPKPRNYRQKTPKKMVQLALRSALSDRASGQRVAVVEHWPWEQPSTAAGRQALQALGLDGRVLVVVDRQRDENVYLSFRNLSEVHVLLAGELNAYDVLCSDWVVFTVQTLPGEGGAFAPSAEGPAAKPAPSGEGADDTLAPAEGADHIPAPTQTADDPTAADKTAQETTAEHTAAVDETAQTPEEVEE
jgi:large subunit ribosomal protein L4